MVLTGGIHASGALVVAPYAFSDMVVTFRARCRRRRSEPFYFNLQISWRAQHSGLGGGLWRALSCWTCDIAARWRYLWRHFCCEAAKRADRAGRCDS